MKKTQLKDALRNISKQRVSWLSILIIAMLAVMVFSGVNHGARGLALSGLRFYEETNFRDVEMISTMLFTKEDISDLKKLGTVYDVEGKQSTTGTIDTGDVPVEVNVVSLTERINKPILVEGALPEKKNECVLEVGTAEKTGLKVGDSFTIQGTKDKLPEYLSEDKFVVKGIIMYSDMACDLKVVGGDGYVIVPFEAFDLKDNEGCFMRALVRFRDALDLDRFTEEYRTAVDNGKAEIDRLADVNTVRRTEEMKAYANGKLDEKRSELEEGKKKLTDARRELDIGGFKIEQGELQLEDGRKELDAAKVELSEGLEKLKEGKTELDANKTRLDDAAAQLAAGKKQLDDAKQQLEAAEPQLKAGWSAIEDGKEQMRQSLRKDIAEFSTANGGTIYMPASSWTKPNYNIDLTNPAVTASEFQITNDFTVNLYELEAAVNNPVLLKDIMCDMVDADPELSPFAKQEVKRTIQASNITLPISPQTKQAIDGVRQWDAVQDQYSQGLIRYKAGLAQYEENFARYLEGKRQWDQGEDQYRGGLEQALDGHARIESGTKEIADNQEKLDQARREIENGEAEYADGAKQAEQGTEELIKAQLDIDNMAPCKWVLLDTRSSFTFNIVMSSGKNVQDLGYTFAVAFIIVAALVIYSTVGKIAEDQRRLLGTTKALGLFNKEILGKYMIFGLTASISGMLLGILIGHFALQKFVIVAYGKLYVYDTQRGALPGLMVAVLIGGIILTAAAVFAACTSLLREPARELMQAKMPVIKHKKGRGRSRLSLQARLILLNVRSDRKRIIVTIASIAGCCMTLVTGFSMRSAIAKTVDAQFGGFVHYQFEVSLSPDTSDVEKQKITDVLDDYGADFMDIESREMLYQVKDEMGGANLFVCDTERFNDFYSWREAGNEDVSSGGKGIFVNSLIADDHGLSVGDIITLYDGKMQSHSARVAGIFTAHMSSLVFASKESYENIFGEKMSENAIIAHVDQAREDELLHELRELSGVKSITVTDDQKKSVKSITGMTDYLALIMVFVAGMMAFFILMNLVNMNINQKKPELTVMRINGFTVREVKGYIQKESIVSTAVGIIIGLIVGYMFTYLVLTILQGNILNFIKSVQWDAIIISVAITVFYTVLINTIALRKVKDLKLSDM